MRLEENTPAPLPDPAASPEYREGWLDALDMASQALRALDGEESYAALVLDRMYDLAKA